MTRQEYEHKKRECWIDLALDAANINKVTIEEYKRIFNGVFDTAYALGKQENEADVVISGWVCRDKKDNTLNLHAEKPYRTYSHYNTDDMPDWWKRDYASFLPLDKDLFLDLTWESDPLPVEITIKRKNVSR